MVWKWQVVLGLAAAGALGTLARYALSGWVGRLHPESLVIAPLGTLAVNALGCFLFGLVWAWTATRSDVSPEVRLVVLAGFLGAFTTFSTFGFETMHLLREQAWGWAIANVLAQNVVGVAMAFLGFVSGRALSA